MSTQAGAGSGPASPQIDISSLQSITGPDGKVTDTSVANWLKDNPGTIAGVASALGIGTSAAVGTGAAAGGAVAGGAGLIGQVGAALVALGPYGIAALVVALAATYIFGEKLVASLVAPGAAFGPTNKALEGKSFALWAWWHSDIRGIAHRQLVLGFIKEQGRESDPQALTDQCNYFASSYEYLKGTQKDGVTPQRIQEGKDIEVMGFGDWYGSMESQLKAKWGADVVPGIWTKLANATERPENAESLRIIPSLFLPTSYVAKDLYENSQHCRTREAGNKNCTMAAWNFLFRNTGQYPSMWNQAAEDQKIILANLQTQVDKIKADAQAAAAMYNVSPAGIANRLTSAIQTATPAQQQKIAAGGGILSAITLFIAGLRS